MPRIKVTIATFPTPGQSLPPLNEDLSPEEKELLDNIIAFEDLLEDNAYDNLDLASAIGAF